MGVSFGFTRLFQQCDKVGPYWVSVMVVFCIGKTHLLIGFNLISYHVFQFGNLLNIGLMVTMATIR